VTSYMGNKRLCEFDLSAEKPTPFDFQSLLSLSLFSQNKHPLFRLAASVPRKQQQGAEVRDKDCEAAALLDEFKQEEKKTSQKDPRYYEHCGPFGETLLHTACLFGNIKIAEHLLKEHANKSIFLGQYFIDAQYQKEPYMGETALHIAIVRGDIPLVETLLHYGANRRKKCHGEIFKPPAGLYLGELPLSFAACIGGNIDNKRIFDLIMREEKADPAYIALIKRPAKVTYLRSHHILAETDLENGNTLLHLLVMKSDIAMYDYITKMYSDDCESLQLELMENNDHLTPVKLSAKLGNPKFFDYLMKKRRKSHWIYGIQLLCVTYCLLCVLTTTPFLCRSP